MGKAAELINLRRPELAKKWAHQAMKFQQAAAHRIYYLPTPAVEECNMRLAAAEAERAKNEN
jgi:hypothetical protein